MFVLLVEFAAISGAAILGAIIILSVLRPRKEPVAVFRQIGRSTPGTGTVFLFQNDQLVDATTDAWALISNSNTGQSDFSTMIAAIGTEFPNLEEALYDNSITEVRIRGMNDPTIYVDISRQGGRLRISLNGDESGAYETATSRLSNTARDTQAALMQQITTSSPQLVWQTDSSGSTAWANDAYFATLSEHDLDTLGKTEPGSVPSENRRIAVRLEKENKERWFDVLTVPHGDGFLNFANDATDIVKADTARTEFVKTLGKTFAELSIGIAIFDKNRALTMFNPALLDMTKLPVDFLSASPAIDNLLDRLRELRMMPEPKNYSSWREQFTAVETEAKDGTYSKNWSLADGQTFRVTGRPYPDGAFALLFEDISAEVSLTRRFRLDIETGQAVLDTLPDAIAVFSPTGTLVMSNQAYAALWSNDPEKVLEHRVLQSEMKIWQDHCIPSPMWAEMRDFIQQLGGRKPWMDQALLDDGRHLQCNAIPIAGGMMMVRFVIAQPKRPQMTKIVQTDHVHFVGKR